MSAHVLDFSASSRARPASVAIADLSAGDSAAFPPSKRARTGENGGESAPHDASRASARDAAASELSAPEGTLMERLLLELSASAAWKLSRERSVVQNEAFLNEQLEHAVLLSGGGEMTAELSRLPFAGLVDAASLLPQKLQQRVDERVRHAMDVVSWLLVVRQHDMRRQDELLEKLRMTQKDVERKDHQVQQLRVDVDALKTQLAQQENMFHGREQALLAERKSLQQDKKHLEVTCAKLQGQETAFKTQLRRKDVEYERLKKSLQDAVQRSAKEQRGMSMGKVLNDLTERRKTAQRVVQSHETQMSRRLVENLERARDDLLFENEALAKNFESLQKTVESVNSQYKKAVSLFLAQRGDGGNTDETWELARVPLDDFTPAPLQLGVKANVPEFIAETVHELGDKVRLFERAMQAELDYATEHPSEEVVALLKHKLAEAENVIAEQDRLVQALLLESTVSPAKKPSASGPSQHLYEKENVHVNTGKRHDSPTLARSGGRRRPVEHLVLEEWEDSLHTEFQALRRKNQHLNDERNLLQSQGEKLDLDRIAFEARNFEHFFGRGIASVNVGGDDIVMQDIDCPTSPRTATYLRSIGIFPSEIE